MTAQTFPREGHKSQWSGKHTWLKVFSKKIDSNWIQFNPIQYYSVLSNSINERERFPARKIDFCNSRDLENIQNSRAIFAEKLDLFSLLKRKGLALHGQTMVQSTPKICTDLFGNWGQRVPLEVGKESTNSTNSSWFRLTLPQIRAWLIWINTNWFWNCICLYNNSTKVCTLLLGDLWCRLGFWC